MIALTPDPRNPERLILSVTLAVFVEKTSSAAVVAEIDAEIRRLARFEFRKHRVRRQLGKLAHAEVLRRLDALLKKMNADDGVSPSASDCSTGAEGNENRKFAVATSIS